MSRFRKVAAGTWGDERFRALSEPAKHLWLYLLTGNEVTSLPGILVVGRAGLAEALGWSPSRLDKAFAELEASKDAEGVPMARADWRARVIWLPKGHRHNPPANPNVIMGWKDLWRSVPECALKRDAHAALRAFIFAFGPEFAKAFTDAIDVDPVARRRKASQPRETPAITPETVTGTVPDTVSTTNSDSFPEPSLARARAAPAPAPAPASEIASSPARHGAAAAVTHDPPPWFLSAVGTVEMGTGIEIDRGAAWLRYEGHRAQKGITPSEGDARYWLTTVLVREAAQDRDRRRQREDASDRSHLRPVPDPPAEDEVDCAPASPEEAAALTAALRKMAEGSTPAAAASGPRVSNGDDHTPAELAVLEAKRAAAIATLRAEALADARGGR